MLDGLAPIGSNASTSIALAINASGHAVGVVSGGIGLSAARWDDTALKILDPYNGAPNNIAFAINDFDYAVGMSGGEETPVIWDPAGHVTRLPCASFGTAFAINNSRQVAGNCGSVAVRWDPSPDNPNDLTLMTMTVLPQVLGQDWSRAYGINDAGQIVGETGPGYGQYVVRWDGPQSTVLDTLPGTIASRASAINNSGYEAGFNAIESPGGGSSLLAVLWSPNVCGDGVRKGNEWCDDGNTVSNDGCEPVTCTITLETTGDTTVAAGGVVSTLGTNTGATPTDPVETRITSPAAGTVAITETTPSMAPDGFEFAPAGSGPIGQQVNISAPPATPESPLKIEFFIDLSQIPGGDINSIELSRDGILVPSCDEAAPVSPLLDTDGGGNLDAHDPCVRRELIPSSDPTNAPDDSKLTVFTTHASAWLMLVATTCGNGVVDAGEQCDDGPRNGTPASCCSATCTSSVGTPCDDGNLCTQTDQCNASGVCAGSNPITCAAGDACHAPETCNPASGVCMSVANIAPTDSDSDGTDDCQDACPNDSTKILPGFCGCGIPDTWSGILQPINADGSSIFKLGSTVPVKFALTGSCAVAVQGSLVAKLFVAKLTNNVAGTELEATSTSAADSGNTFRYDPTSAQYVFNLGTKSLSSGTWQLRIDLGDGAARTVRISLK